MILGLSLFAWVHIALSLVALVSGIVVLNAMFSSQSPDQWTLAFFVSAVATAVTGFGFPVTRFDASHWVAIVTVVALAAAIVARYAYHFAGTWRPVYVAGAVIAVYLNVYTLIMEAFARLPMLKTLAPTMTELPFVIVQLAALALFCWVGYAAMKAFQMGGGHHGAHA